MIKEIHDIKETYLFLQKAFDPSELREYDWMKEIYDQKKFKIYASLKDEQLLGVITLWEFDDFNYIEHFAVDENYRGQGLGSMIIEDMKLLSDKPLVLEVEKIVDTITQKRVHFYEKHGFQLSSYLFVQPPLRDNAKDVLLIYMSYPTLLDNNMYDRIFTELKNKVYTRSEYESVRR
ncbi:MAG: GNAT family N-acetyltransferase [Erysipelotrichaceae bacterium]|nr:GNAT family N-acetyltransferase [Erysipelotrichaceae bacterium]